MEPDNPYTFLEGYKVCDVHGNEVGEVSQTVYDAPTDVLKYVIVDGRIVPADEMKVNAKEEIVSVPYDAETIESAPELQEFSGEFDETLRKHYGYIDRR
ncbi:MAG: PRC-barrel domain-containing protein [Rubrobacteraceae bacterium]